MTKSLTINIGEQLFEIEQEAYNELRAYINSLQDHFKNDPDGEEIVADIEERIAELFVEQQTPGFKTILKVSVDFVKLKMGTVDEFEPVIENMFETDEPTLTSLNTDVGAVGVAATKKLMRDDDDRVLGGVCAGMGHYFNVNPVVIRILVLLLFFSLGFGLLFYMLLWIVIPKATTTTDKLMMKGLPINVNTMADSVKDDNIRQNKKSNNPIIEFIGQFMHYFARFMFAFGKVLLIIFAFAFLVTTIAGFITTNFGILKGGVLMESFSASSGAVFWWMKIMLLIAFGIPILLLLIALIYLLLNRNYLRANYVLPLLGLWIISLIMLGIYSAKIGTDFIKESSVKEVIELHSFDSDTLFIGMLDSEVEPIFDNNDLILTNETLGQLKESLYIGNISFDVKKSNNNTFKLVVEKEAKGESKVKAASRAQKTDYYWKQDNDHLLLNSYFGIHKNTKWRMQKVYLNLEVPEGKFIHFDHQMKYILDDVDNVQDMYDKKMVDRVWQMTSNGLSCIDCEE